jgi:tRNA (cmo5U34)-methyltransferase
VTHYPYREGSVITMSNLIKQQFDAVARSYDQQRRQLIPCFDDFYSLAATWVDIDKKAPRILDLGAGTGLFSSYIRHRYPEASLTLVDFSEDMLNEAQIRFADDANIQYIVADYATYDFKEQYDAVISSLSIHHLSHLNKSKLFFTIFNLLSDDGIFVNADQVAGSSPYFDHRYQEQWENTVRRSGLSDQAVEASIDRKKLDLNASVEDQLSWLKQAGFKETDCIYKYHEFAIFFSQKNHRQHL